MEPLQEEILNLHAQAKAISAQYAGKAWDPEKEAEFDRLMDAIDAKSAQIAATEDAEKKAKERSARLEQAERFMASAKNQRLAVPSASSASASRNSDEEAKAALFAAFLKHGASAIQAAEAKGLQTDIDAGGGFVTAPTVYASTLLQNVTDQTVVRQLSNVVQNNSGGSLGYMSLNNDAFEDATWTVELATGNATAPEPFGKRVMQAHPLAQRVLISRNLIRTAIVPIEGIVQGQMARKFSETLEKAYFTGSGSQQPLGVFTASSDGVSTDRDVTASSATAFTEDDLIEMVYSGLKPQYRDSTTARWVAHTDFVKRVRKLKDGTGKSKVGDIWTPRMGDVPAAILGIPYIESRFAPSTFTAGNYVAVLGDFRFYTIFDSLSFSVQVLDELYAASNQRGYIGRYEGDGQPVLAEAFARLKLAAS